MSALWSYVRRHHLALVALFVALGGTSYAAVALPRNSVGTAQIKPGGVKTSDLGLSAVTTSRVRNFSLLARDFKPGQLPSGGSGARGPRGPRGLRGPRGRRGAAGLVEAVIVRRTDFPVAANTTVSGFTGCPTGERIIGGSVNLANGAADNGSKVLISRPAVSNAGNGLVPDNGNNFFFWKGTSKAGATADTMRVFAFCVKSPGATTPTLGPGGPGNTD